MLVTHAGQGITDASTWPFYPMLTWAIMLCVSHKRVSIPTFCLLYVREGILVQLLPLSAQLSLCTPQLLQNVLESFKKMFFLMTMTISFVGWDPHNDCLLLNYLTLMSRPPTCLSPVICINM